MNGNYEPERVRRGPREVTDEDMPHTSTPATRQLRTVGQRRRDAEQKLEHHLQEVRHKNEQHNDEPQPGSRG
jgi:hypothetical protein